MKTITILRKELTTYANIVELPDDEADAILDNPKAHARKLDSLCRASAANWMDAEDPEWDAEVSE